MKFKHLLIGLAVLGTSVSSCSHTFKIEDQENVEIASVTNGNTVVLDNGLTVHLYGVSSNSTATEGYLNSLIGKTISLLPDSQGDQEFYTYDDEIWAYAMLDENGKPLNRELIKLGGKSAYNPSHVSDSLEAYKKIHSGPIDPLTSDQLGTLLNSSSFIIWGKDKADNLFNGTGFFISRDGLALSCSHVVNYSSSYIVQLSNPQGEIIESPYSIKTPLYCGDHNNTSEDFAIFYVDLDENSKRSIRPLSLADKIPSPGSKIFTVGNPGVYGETFPMSFASGSLSNYRSENGRIQADINVGPGFSGGPVVDEYGQVIGINQSIVVDPDLNSKYVFLTDIMMVRKKLDELNESYEGK